MDGKELGRGAETLSMDLKSENICMFDLDLLL
jgi:hypothetical protein